MRPDGDGGGRERLARLVRVTVAVLLSLAALHVLAANILLSTSLFEKIVDAPSDTIDIHYESAWSIVPGRAHAKKVSIRGRDAQVEWRLVLDDVDFRVGLLGLLKRRFELSHVRAEGLSFRLRRRLAAAPSSPEEVAHLAPIEGLPPWSLRPPSKPTRLDRLWTVELEDVVAHDVREVWVDQTRFHGSARVTGRFYLKPLRAVEIGPAHVAIARGHVTTNRGQVANALDGSALDVTSSRFHPQRAKGADILQGLSLAGHAHVTVPDLGLVPLALAGDLTLQGALEVHRAVVHLTSGVLKRNSHLKATVRDVVVTSDGHRVRGDLALSADVAAPGNKHDQLTFRAELTRAVVSRRSKAKGPMRPVLETTRALVTGDSRKLDLAHLLDDLHLVVEVPDGKANTRELSDYIPPKAPVELVSGHASAALRFELWAAQRRATGRGTIRADDLDLRLAKMRVRGSVKLQGEFASYQFETRQLQDATLMIEASDGTLSSHAAPATPLVRLNTALLHAHVPIADIDDPLRALSVSIDVPSARFASSGLLRAYLPHGSEMQIATSHSSFSLESDLEIAEHLARGSLELESSGLTIDHRGFRLNAHVGARARVHSWRWETGSLALDEAKVEVTDLAIAKSRVGTWAPTAAMSVARIGLQARSAHFEFGDPLAELMLSAAIVDAEVRDFSALNAFLPKKATFALEGDVANFGAQLELDIENHAAKGTFRATASNIGVVKGSTHLHGNVDLFATVSDWRLQHHTMTLVDSRVDMTNVVGRFTPEGPPQVSAARLSLAAGVPKFDLERPTLKGADFHFVFESGELPDARALATLLPEDSVLGIESGAARVEADITVSSSRRAATGSVEVDVERAGVRLHTTRFSGNLRLLVSVSGFVPGREALDISGTRLEMRDVSVAGSTLATSHWHGDVAFSRASLDLGRGRTLLDGDILFAVSNAKPFLALVLKSGLPKIAVDLIGVPSLDGSLRLIAGPDLLAFVDAHTWGGDFRLRGDYAVRGGHRRGGIVATKAFISVGLKFDDRGTHLRLFGLDGWLRDQGCAVSDQLATPIASCPRSWLRQNSVSWLEGPRVVGERPVDLHAQPQVEP